MPGRNDPCPCGSGKKYKRCCLGKGEEVGSTVLSPRFRFEPGSYGGPGAFLPSIACLQQVRPNDWEYHFVLVHPDNVHGEEDAAVDEATRDLDRAFASCGQGMGGEDFVALSLRSSGYKSVKDFQVVKT